MKPFIKKPMKSMALIMMLLISTLSISVEIDPDDHYAFELELPIPFPICDPVREIDPDPVSWRIGIIKITPEMRDRLLQEIEVLGPDPQPWRESEYCTLVY